MISARVLFETVYLLASAALIRKGFNIKNLLNPPKIRMDRILQRFLATVAIAMLCFYGAASALAQPPDSRPTWMFPALGIEVIRPTQNYHPVPVPLRQQKAIHTLVKRPQSSDPIPIRTIPVPASEDYKNDPLFQEIQRLMLKSDVSPTNGNDVVHGGSASNGNGSQPRSLESETSQVSTRSGTNIDSISDARWHAAESILSAARMLEKDVAESVKRGDIESTSKNLHVIKKLRTQVLELLREN